MSQAKDSSRSKAIPDNSSSLLCCDYSFEARLLLAGREKKAVGRSGRTLPPPPPPAAETAASEGEGKAPPKRRRIEKREEGPLRSPFGVEEVVGKGRKGPQNAIGGGGGQGGILSFPLAIMVGGGRRQSQSLGRGVERVMLHSQKEKKYVSGSGQRTFRS